MQGRYFGGKKYYYNRSIPYKKEATAYANQLRKKGNLVRIVPYSEGYEIWDRRKL